MPRSEQGETARSSPAALATRRTPRFMLLLATALIFLIVTPLLGDGSRGVMGGKIILTVMVLVAVAELPRSQLHLGVVLGAAAILTDWFDQAMHMSGVLPVSLALRAAFCGYVAAMVLSVVVRERKVTIDTIAGAACAYLFIGFTWAMFFALLDHFEPGAIGFPEAWASTQPGRETVRYFYFSFVTLTTLGYGDVVPKTLDATGLVVAEAVIGQLYLAVLIARLVGLHLSLRGERDG